MTASHATLRRMVRPRKPARGVHHTVMEGMADKIFRGPAKLEHGIDLLVREATAERLSHASMMGGFPTSSVPHVLNHSDGRTGLLVLDGDMTDALIEQQTLGRISSAPRVERPVTSIDAALSTAFAGSIAEKLVALAPESPDAALLAGMRCGRPQIDAAALSLALTAKQYDVLRVKLDIGPGAKTCNVQLVFPAADIDIAAPAPGAPNPAMVALLQDARLKLHVRLPNVPLSLKTLIGLQPDSIITLPQDALASASLRDRAGSPIGSGRLGQLKGCRAIRVTSGQLAPKIVPIAATSDTGGDIGSLPETAVQAPMQADVMMQADDPEKVMNKQSDGAGAAAPAETTLETQMA